MSLPIREAMPQETVHQEPLSVAELQAALALGQMRTVYQPIVRLSDRRPVGLEVLARLHHPLRGRLEPEDFVPAMERAGLGNALFQAVVKRAFADWRDAGLATLDLSLAVNLPLDVLLLPATRPDLDRARAECGVPAAAIIIELTESQELGSLPDLARAAADLRAAGYGLAIDDVGPAIRDHGPLLRLPFTALKLDRGLVQDAGHDAAAAAFLDSAIASARAAGLTVIAEGVEDEATWAGMASRGVEQVQGYLVSRPLAADEVVAWHAAWCRTTLEVR